MTPAQRRRSFQVIEGGKRDPDPLLMFFPAMWWLWWWGL